MNAAPRVNDGAAAMAVGQPAWSRDKEEYQATLERAIVRLRASMPRIGLRTPKIGREDLSWTYCGPFDWVIGFHTGQLWLAYQLTGDMAFANSARARRPAFRRILASRVAQDHDLGFIFSPTCVAEYLMTADAEARRLALDAAAALAARFNPAGNYIPAWNAFAPDQPERSRFAAGRIIADSMMNMALLHWAHAETGRADFLEIAESHSATVLATIVRRDATSFHCYRFDPASGERLGGDTHQGFSADSCWARGQAWLINGFVQSYLYTGNPEWLHVSRRLAATARALLGDRELVPWDYCLPPEAEEHVDSSAAAIMACGLYMLADATEGEESAEWLAFADRLLDGLLRHCDLTTNPRAQGLLDCGASHVPDGKCRNMLPYGDYFYMEALMRALGHTSFFW